MKRKILGSMVSLAFVAVILIPSARAETTASNEAMLEQIQVLMAKLQELQQQMAAIRGEIKETLQSNIAEGSTNEDIRKVQELLATDAQIYPEGLITGYFGPRTKEAIMRFQERHGLTVTGIVDKETKGLIEEYLKEKRDGQIPPGLLRAPGIAKKIENRYTLRCTDQESVGPLCARLRNIIENHDHADDMDEDHDHADDMDEDADTDSDSSADTVTRKDVETAIRKANKAISDVALAIRKSDAETADAKVLLTEARTTLVSAKRALTQKDYDLALEHAEKAESIADEAEDTLDDSGSDTDDEEDDSAESDDESDE